MAIYNGLNITQLAMESVDRRGGEDAIEGNLTLVQVVSEVVQELETQREMSEAEYEQFLADVWVGVVLTLMVLSCICCMCSCLLYHKFQQWKLHVLEQRAAASRDPDCRGDTESLPSYTLVSGLPSYEEALEQLKQVQALRRGIEVVVIDCGKQVEAETPSTLGGNSSDHGFNVVQGNQMTRLSVAELLQLYKLQQQQQLPQYQQQQLQIGANVQQHQPQLQGSSKI
ncbi:uncharacterized protein LOC105686764 [Athalia rosae]|uniref:uncharacterized protein LOC105686764 n=1 Tax=Athalia rosae TaxID=37344 RepID=UPI0006267B58|nr:uncharacterized protein LOC105686764 [Athalia rosae]